jgi:hypothetical protein
MGEAFISANFEGEQIGFRALAFRNRIEVSELFDLFLRFAEVQDSLETEAKLTHRQSP